MRTVVFAFLALTLVGCGPKYRTALVTPSPQPSAPPMTYEDDNIRATFTLEEGPRANNNAMVTSYHGVGFSLLNKTDKPMTIDWNKVAFKDAAGNSGNAVTHKGVSYQQAAAPKAPTSLPAHQTLSDVVIPCEAINFVGGETGWVVDMMPENLPHETFGVYLPVDIGGTLKEYSFDFTADAVDPPPSTPSPSANGSRAR